VFVGGCGGRIAFGQVGGDVGIDRASGTGKVPSAVVNETAVLFFPESVVAWGVHEWSESAGQDGNLGALHDFEEPEGVTDLKIAPVVTGGNADAEGFDVRSVEEHGDCLEIGGRGSEGVLVDNDFAGGHKMRR
jgi:hypothetical protein